MSIEDIVSLICACANCGKEGSDVNNTCNKCKIAKYCNAACKKKHRHKHKKDCEEHQRLAAEHAAKLHDEALFKQPPPQYEDCPICFQLLPILETGIKYMSCCGKVICSGCGCAPLYDNQGNIVAENKCPFCRTLAPESDEESFKRINKLVDVGDPVAIYNHGVNYRDRQFGFPQNYTKALELWHRAAELGYTRAYVNIGCAYEDGDGVEIDMKKATHYWELAAMGGDVSARHNLGVIEGRAGNMDRALKHYTIAVRNGSYRSLNMVKEFYSKGHATKEDYSKALRSYQGYLNEVKSAQRDDAATFDGLEYIE